MDRLVRRFSAHIDGDLRLCLHRGIAYQADMGQRFDYGQAYFDHYSGLEGSDVADRLNAARCAMLERHAAAGAKVFDCGAGAGTFVRTARARGFDCKGFDVMPQAVRLLKDAGAWAETPEGFDAVTFWDSLEHIDAPEVVLKRIERGALVLVAIPIHQDLRRIRESKHFKPDEHLWHFTRDGFVGYMALYGYRLIEESTHETDCGRESIGAFAFRRDLPDYGDHIAAYQEMHSTRFYGSSATELHLTTAWSVVRTLKPMRILDYGCGRSDIVAHFWKDGWRDIARYDPAIPQYKRMPEGRFDLVFCMDVLEHIPMADIDRVLREIRDKGYAALFTISTKPARAKLPDGRNAHVTLLKPQEWIGWLADVFDSAEQIPSKFEHEIIVLTRAK